MSGKLHQFDYIFAISMIFAFLDAWNIGANDVANSFASSVSSRSLKYWQAMILAALMEFLGAVLAGSRVSDTIRSKIIDITVFEDNPAVLLLTMACALVGSSLWLTLATSFGLPVSTTHSIVGGVIGSGIAAVGAKNIHWGWNGFSQIVASWFIAPAIAGCFAAIFFLISKYTVLERKHSLRNGLILMPVLIFATFAILTMLIVWKGAPNLKLDKLSTGAILGSIFGVGAVAAIIYFIFLLPYFKRRLIHEDWRLKWYHVILGPTFYFKSNDDIPPIPKGHLLVPDYYAGKYHTDDEPILQDSETIEKDQTNVQVDQTSSDKGASNYERDLQNLESKYQDIEQQQPTTQQPSTPLAPKQTTKQLWFSLAKQPKQWPRLIWLVISHGWTQDVISNQMQKGGLSGDLKDMHSRSKYYDNKIEYLFSLLQAITACTMSFAHGSNDIANAAGPLATVYNIYTTNKVDKKADVPIWVLCYTAAALVLGVWTFGYNIMRNLGNRLILQSPSRGFSIELGAAVTTVMATQLGIPVSTTQEAVGATVFVGLCNKDVKSVNWRIVAYCYFGWIFTLPCAGLIAGILNGIILNAPSRELTYQLQ
ncbi:Phosphate permease PHO89 [Wickerhamomyces ciferrii]|uniref:Phosphate transporter n=1 Tax=Wickerhamomyces ciferrii (strain ATCC 14091 / BCRC 22168 / CBS 111 / JCM 3599 / NBRC 0793 / NRRL Y-1031 F-60-10) TaxID=1206466 RepID=K0KUA2_WICCF|nr:Phosphate permease PHO89 [Wickerhamomyces ciferrii]CCH44763.1 Phosphate permease PHO89 [Wickerhamomyces ciferrii]